MYKVVGIRFKKAGKVYYFDPGEIDLSMGNAAIVETARGVEYGDVVVAPKMVPDDEVVAPLKQVLRKATDADKVQLAENEKKEEKAFGICQQKIAVHGLPMKLVDVEYTFDNNKIIFYFTAEGRVDFRELVKDLAGVFRTRIELRQIGVRDEAKMLGGLGPCGRALCCRSFLGDFEPVSIRMAKEQNLSLNPTKISGICGRLMCCLKFESYGREAKRAEEGLLGQPGESCGGCGAVDHGAPYQQAPGLQEFGGPGDPEELEELKELEKLEELEKKEQSRPKEEQENFVSGVGPEQKPRTPAQISQPLPRNDKNRDNHQRNGSGRNNGRVSGSSKNGWGHHPHGGYGNGYGKDPGKDPGRDPGKDPKKDLRQGGSPREGAEPASGGNNQAGGPSPRHSRRPRPLQGRRPARIGGRDGQDTHNVHDGHNTQAHDARNGHDTHDGQGRPRHPRHGQHHGPSREAGGVTNGADGQSPARGKVSGPESNSSKGSS